MSLLASHTDNPTFRNASYILMGLALLIVLHYHCCRCCCRLS